MRILISVTCPVLLCVSLAQDSEATQISGPRDLLRACGIDDSHFDRLRDGRPVDDDEKETLLKVMYRLREFRAVDVKRWAHAEMDLAELFEEGEAARGQIFPLLGRVTRVEVLRPLPEVIERFELKQYYRCEFLLDPRQQPAVVFTRNVPKAWRRGGPVDARASALGVFLKFAGTAADRPVPVFVAPRIAWHPQTLLGKLGMDLGLLDDVRNRRGLTGHDREAFYQMLAAVGRAKPGQLLRQANKRLKQADEQLKRTDKQGEEHFSVVPLFNQSDQQRGRLFALSGTARRVVRIRVEDPDIVARFGIDHYYNLFVYTDDSQDNPIVFCVRRLPKGMPTGDGPHYGERVRVAGFFFKTWAYRIEMPAEIPGPEARPGPHRQLAPLLIGREPVWYPAEQPATNTMAGAIAGGLFVLALLGIWLALWRYGRADKRFHDQTIAKTLAADSSISLDEIDLSTNGTPDFTGLEEIDREPSENEETDR